MAIVIKYRVVRKKKSHIVRSSRTYSGPRLHNPDTILERIIRFP